MRLSLTLAERFLLTRRRMGITQDEMARILRVSRRTINRAELEGRANKTLLDRFKILESRNVHPRAYKRKQRNHADPDPHQSPATG